MILIVCKKCGKLLYKTELENMNPPVGYEHSEVPCDDCKDKIRIKEERRNARIQKQTRGTV